MLAMVAVQLEFVFVDITPRPSGCHDDCNFDVEMANSLLFTYTPQQPVTSFVCG